MYKNLIALNLLIISTVTLFFSFTEDEATFPTQFEQLVNDFPSLPRYVEAGYYENKDTFEFPTEEKKAA